MYLSTFFREGVKFENADIVYKEEGSKLTKKVRTNLMDSP